MTRANPPSPPSSPVRPSLRHAAEVFLAGTGAVRAALSDPAVAASWDRPSILEDQLVGGLAGHLARTGGWIVPEYLDVAVPDGPVVFEDAGDYYATLVGGLDVDAHRAIRERGAALGADGPAALVTELDSRLDGLPDRLDALDDDATIAAYQGQSMRLRDYLVTRVVEQVVHLDDLSRSVDGADWPVPPAAVDLVLAVAIDAARRRHGDGSVLRALYRAGSAAGVFPVLAGPPPTG